MSSLLVRRPPGWRMHEEDAQGSLFGGEAFLPPATRPAPEAPPEEAAPWAPPEEAAPWAPPEEGVSAGDVRVARAGGALLAGPTLDDAVSRAWEGLVAGVPAACPVCHAEIEPGLAGSPRGHCGSCHVTLD